MAKTLAEEKACEIADQIVPKYRYGTRSYSCTGDIAKLHEIGGTDTNGDRFASRELSLANTHVEDAVMRAVRHITA